MGAKRDRWLAIWLGAAVATTVALYSGSPFVILPVVAIDSALLVMWFEWRKYESWKHRPKRTLDEPEDRS